MGSGCDGSDSKSVEVIATPDHVLHCWQSLTRHLKPATAIASLNEPKFDNITSPLFVTWNKADHHGTHRLRGCIGTFQPQPLHTAIKDYAITSGTRDHRFPPIQPSEFPHLHCTVSLLHSFEPASHWKDWEIGTHGIIIEFTDPPSSSQKRNATFLPDVASAQGWSREETLQHLIRKSGCRVDWQTVVNSTIKVTRYQSTMCSLSYEEHVELMKMRREPSGVQGGVVPTSGGTAKSGRPTSDDNVKSGGRSKRASLVTVPAA